MKVWLISNDSHGEVYVYAEHVDIAEVPYVAGELEMLLGDEDYEQERTDFLETVSKIKQRGYGYADIVERFSVELVKVKE